MSYENKPVNHENPVKVIINKITQYGAYLAPELIEAILDYGYEVYATITAINERYSTLDDKAHALYSYFDFLLERHTLEKG